MVRYLILFVFFCIGYSCDTPSKQIVNTKGNAIVATKNTPKTMDILEPDTILLPNGKRLLNNVDSFMSLYYKEVVGIDTLQGGYITCYGIDDSTKYFYLRQGNNLTLLNQTPINTSTWSLGTLEKDLKHLFITIVDNGNGVPKTFQCFSKKTGKNLLGTDVTAWNYRYFNDSLFFLYDNHFVQYEGNRIHRKKADSIFLYNAISGKRQAFKLPKENSYDIIYYDLKRITRNSVLITREVYLNEEQQVIKFKR